MLQNIIPSRQRQTQILQISNPLHHHKSTSPKFKKNILKFQCSCELCKTGQYYKCMNYSKNKILNIKKHMGKQSYMAWDLNSGIEDYSNEPLAYSTRDIKQGHLVNDLKEASYIYQINNSYNEKPYNTSMKKHEEMDYDLKSSTSQKKENEHTIGDDIMINNKNNNNNIEYEYRKNHNLVNYPHWLEKKKNVVDKYIKAYSGNILPRNLIKHESCAITKIIEDNSPKITEFSCFENSYWDNYSSSLAFEKQKDSDYMSNDKEKSNNLEQLILPKSWQTKDSINIGNQGFNSVHNFEIKLESLKPTSSQSNNFNPNSKEYPIIQNLNLAQFQLMQLPSQASFGVPLNDDGDYDNDNADDLNLKNDPKHICKLNSFRDINPNIEVHRFHNDDESSFISLNEPNHCVIATDGGFGDVDANGSGDRGNKNLNNEQSSLKKQSDTHKYDKDDASIVFEAQVSDEGCMSLPMNIPISDSFPPSNREKEKDSKSLEKIEDKKYIAISKEEFDNVIMSFLKDKYGNINTISSNIGINHLEIGNEVVTISLKIDSSPSSKLKYNNANNTQVKHKLNENMEITRIHEKTKSQSPKNSTAKGPKVEGTAYNSKFSKNPLANEFDPSNNAFNSNIPENIMRIPNTHENLIKMINDRLLQTKQKALLYNNKDEDDKQYLDRLYAYEPDECTYLPNQEGSSTNLRGSCVSYDELNSTIKDNQQRLRSSIDFKKEKLYDKYCVSNMDIIDIAKQNTINILNANESSNLDMDNQIDKPMIMKKKKKNNNRAKVSKSFINLPSKEEKKEKEEEGKNEDEYKSSNSLIKTYSLSTLAFSENVNNNNIQKGKIDQTNSKQLISTNESYYDKPNKNLIKSASYCKSSNKSYSPSLVKSFNSNAISNRYIKTPWKRISILSQKICIDPKGLKQRGKSKDNEDLSIQNISFLSKKSQRELKTNSSINRNKSPFQTPEKTKSNNKDMIINKSTRDSFKSSSKKLYSNEILSISHINPQKNHDYFSVLGKKNKLYHHQHHNYSYQNTKKNLKTQHNKSISTIEFNPSDNYLISYRHNKDEEKDPNDLSQQAYSKHDIEITKKISKGLANINNNENFLKTLHNESNEISLILPYNNEDTLYTTNNENAIYYRAGSFGEPFFMETKTVIPIQQNLKNSEQKTSKNTSNLIQKTLINIPKDKIKNLNNSKDLNEQNNNLQIKENSRQELKSYTPLKLRNSSQIPLKTKINVTNGNNFTIPINSLSNSKIRNSSKEIESKMRLETKNSPNSIAPKRDIKREISRTKVLGNKGTNNLILTEITSMSKAI